MLELLLAIYGWLSQQLLSWTEASHGGLRRWFADAPVVDGDFTGVMSCDTIGWSPEGSPHAIRWRGDAHPGASLNGMSSGEFDPLWSDRCRPHGGFSVVQSSPDAVLPQTQVNSDPISRQAMFLWNVAWQGGGHVLSSL
ncbi:MAG: hypothetical protein U0903_19525 [Planctomycetales bacterium]